TRRASAIATAVLPTPVGPAITATGPFRASLIRPRVDARNAGSSGVGRGLGGVEGTRSLRGAADDVAPGWSPAAQEKRTRAAWSSRPQSAPGPTPELPVFRADT